MLFLRTKMCFPTCRLLYALGFKAHELGLCAESVCFSLIQETLSFEIRWFFLSDIAHPVKYDEHQKQEREENPRDLVH